jgi:geranyl-CoA carboxylase alpha subunit
MDGAVVDILCEAGQTVTRGSTLAVVEAMKMEHPLKADRDGVIAQIHASPGDQVKTRHLIIEIDAPVEP